MVYKQVAIPSNDIFVSPGEIDEIVLMLRYWYGIEFDQWINSEASKYTVILRISNQINKSYTRHLYEYFKSVIHEANQQAAHNSPHNQYNQPGKTSPLPELNPKGLMDFSKARVYLREDPGGNNAGDILELRKTVESCKYGFFLESWLQFFEEKPYRDCSIEITLLFEPFGPGCTRNELTIHINLTEEGKPVIVGFDSSKRKFAYFGFLKNGLEIFKDIENRVAAKRKNATHTEQGEHHKPNVFSFPCEDEEEAIILDGINRTLGISSSVMGDTVHFRLDDADIPGLISYFWIGLPQAIFKLPDQR